jgi:hypothetical protein
MGALVGQVLKYNGSTWVPSNLTSAQLYRGTYEASTGFAPDHLGTAAVAGDYYIVTVAGVYSSKTYAINDWIIYNGVTWDKISPALSVTGFNGRTGAVVPTTGDYLLSELGDVDLSVAPTTNQVLTYDVSGKWVAKTPAVSSSSSGVLSVTSSNTDISVVSSTVSPYLTLNSGTGANQILKLNGTGKIPAVDGSLITSLTPANLNAAVTVDKGGTGLTTGSSGGILYYSSPTALASSSELLVGGVVLGGGAGAAPSTVSGIANQVLRVPNAGGNPSFGSIDISKAAAVTGILPLANGGTGTTSAGGIRSILSLGSAATMATGSTAGMLPVLGTSGIVANQVCVGDIGGGVLSCPSGGMTLSASGNLGIGTTFPSAKIEISSAEPEILGSSPASAVGQLHIHDTGVFNSGKGPTIVFSKENDIGHTATQVAAISGQGYAGTQRLDFFTGTGTTLGASPKMSINNSGNVGIGTITPTATLETRGSVNIYSASNITSATNARQLTIGESSNNSAYRLALGYEIDSGTGAWSGVVQSTAASVGAPLLLNPIGGNVGIGTSAPGTLLHIASTTASTTTTARIENTGAGSSVQLNLNSAAAGYPHILFSQAGTGRFEMGQVASNGNFYFNNNTQSGETNASMVITKAGNIGIGTTAPGSKLDILGNLNITGSATLGGSISYGNAGVRTESRNDAGLRGDAGAKSGFYEASSPVNFPAGATGWWHLLDLRHSNSANNHALQIAGSFFDQDVYIRKTQDVATHAWSKIITQDSSGDVNITPGNFVQNLTHGKNARLLLPAANNGAASGDVNFIWWASEPGQTWTGAGIGRNMYNTTGWPRINGNLTGQMMRFDEGTGIIFTSEDAAGTRYTPLSMAANDITVAGTVTAAGTVLTSDRRWKRNITPLKNVVEKLKQIVGVSYDWAFNEFPEKHFSEKKQIGVIAQDVQKVFPELVLKDSHGYLSVNYSGLIGPLVEAFKVQQTQIDINIHMFKTMQGELDEIKNAITENKREIASLKSENEQLKKENAEIKDRLIRIEKSLKIK